MVNVITLTNSIFLGAFLLETFLYGIYLAVFFPTIWLIWKRRNDGSSYNAVIIVGSALCILFVLATAHLVVSLLKMFIGFVYHENSTNMYAYLTDQIAPLNIASLSIWGSMMVVGDSLVVWRCWVLWERRYWILALFFVLEAAYIVCGVRGITYFASIKVNDEEALFSAKVIAWYTAFNLLSLLTNITVSALISLRLYRVGRKIARAIGSAYARKYFVLLWTYLESGSIYPTFMIVGLALYLAQNPASWLMIIVAPQLMAMTPCLMVLVVLVDRRSLAGTHEPNSTDAQQSSRSWSRRSNVRSTRPPPAMINTSEGSVMQVHVSKEQIMLTDFSESALNMGDKV